VTGRYGTRYQESEALLAVQSGDEDAAREILTGMLPRERWELARAADRLSELATEPT